MARRVRSLLPVAQNSGLLAAVVVLFAFFSLASPYFLTRGNLTVVLLSISVLGLVAVPGGMLVLSGYVDFSVGSMAVLAAIIFGKLVIAEHLAWGLAMPVTLVLGAIWGLIAGLLICHFNLSAIVVTLGGFAGLRGLAEFMSRAETEYGFGSGFGQLGNGNLAGVPVPVVIAASALILGFYVWYKTPYGRHLTAIGADKTVADALGIAVKRIPIVLYVLSATFASLGGLILLSQLDAASLSIGQGLEIQVLTAILLGGVSFSGGRGSLFGVLVGVMFIGILANGLVVINISPFIQGVAVGAALLFAAAMDVVYRRLDRLAVQESEIIASLNPLGRAEGEEGRDRGRSDV